MAPVLRDPRQRTPAALLVAARAAAGWGGWSEVDKLLARNRGSTPQFDGEARELLTRSAFERGADTVARPARDGRASRCEEPSRCARSGLDASRARSRAEQQVRQRGGCVRARGRRRCAPVRDWLFLRAAGSERDSAQRAKLFATVSLAPRQAANCVDRGAGARAFQRRAWRRIAIRDLGATVQSLRLRLSVAPDSASRDDREDRAARVSFARAEYVPTRAAAVDVLDKGFTVFTPGEELIVARGTATGPAGARRHRVRARAYRAGADHAERSPAVRPGAVASRSDARRARAVASRAGPARGSGRVSARARAADVGHARRNVARASRDGRRHFRPTRRRRAPRSFCSPTSRPTTATTTQARDRCISSCIARIRRVARAANARFNAAIIALAAGNAAGAAQEFDSLVRADAARRRCDRRELLERSRVGGGRERSGRPDALAARWLRSSRSRTTPSRARSGSATEPGRRPSAADSVAARRRRRQRDRAHRAARAAGHGRRSAVRVRRARRRGDRHRRERLAATAHAFDSARAIVARDSPRAEARRCGPSRRADLPSALSDCSIATSSRATPRRTRSIRRSWPALIRQESSFNPRAVSVAGARGLMQVLPAVGEEVRARSRIRSGIPRCSSTPTRTCSSARRTSRRTSSSTARCRVCSPRTTPAGRASRAGRRKAGAGRSGAVRRTNSVRRDARLRANRAAERGGVPGAL